MVLEGAARMLRTRAVDVLEFEFHRKWGRQSPGRSLPSTVRQLDEFGYRCFWQGNNGSLAPVSGPFWCDKFQNPFWANLVCAQRPELKVLLGRFVAPLWMSHLDPHPGHTGDFQTHSHALPLILR